VDVLDGLATFTLSIECLADLEQTHHKNIVPRKVFKKSMDIFVRVGDNCAHKLTKSMLIRVSLFVHVEWVRCWEHC